MRNYKSFCLCVAAASVVAGCARVTSHSVGQLGAVRQFAPNNPELMARDRVVGSRYLDGRELLDSGDYQGAIQTLEAAATANPDEPMVNWKLGEAYLKSGNRKLALERFDRVGMGDHADRWLRRDPEFLSTYGDALVAAGRRRDAERIYGVSVGDSGDALDISRVNAHTDAGQKLLHSGQWSEAEEHLQKACRLRPESWRSSFLLGQAQFHLGRREAAITTLRKAEKLANGADREEVSTYRHQMGLTREVVGFTPDESGNLIRTVEPEQP